MAHKLLMVDDEVELTGYLKEYFEMKGFTVFTCPSGEEALIILQKEKPDIAVLDMLLKGKMNGVDVLRESKKINLSTKMIMLTGSDTPSEEREALKLGVLRYLNKPVTVKELHDAIDEVLSGKK